MLQISTESTLIADVRFRNSINIVGDARRRKIGASDGASTVFVVVVFVVVVAFVVVVVDMVVVVTVSFISFPFLSETVTREREREEDR